MRFARQHQLPFAKAPAQHDAQHDAHPAAAPGRWTLHPGERSASQPQGRPEGDSRLGRRAANLQFLPGSVGTQTRPTGPAGRIIPASVGVAPAKPVRFSRRRIAHAIETIGSGLMILTFLALALFA